jgi:hypothetical protein
LLRFLARRVEVKESQFTMPPFFCMCSVSFQRFAVMSSKAIEDVAQKGMILCISKVLRGVLLQEFLLGTSNRV